MGPVASETIPAICDFTGAECEHCVAGVGVCMDALRTPLCLKTPYPDVEGAFRSTAVLKKCPLNHQRGGNSVPTATDHNTEPVSHETEELQMFAAQFVPLYRIRPSNFNPRKTFDENKMKELVKSIEEHGLLEPIVVRHFEPGRWFVVQGEHEGKAGYLLRDSAYLDESKPNGQQYDPDGPKEFYETKNEAEQNHPRYEIVCGERRWRACGIAGVRHVPVHILEDVDDAKARELALVENLVRHDIDPIEEAEGLAALIDMGNSPSDLADRLHRSRPAITNATRLLQLPEEVKELVRENSRDPKAGIPKSSARALVSYLEYPKLFEVKLTQAKSGVPSRDLEKLGETWILEQHGAIAEVSAKDIGVEAAKVCTKCDHRRKNGNRDGWICLKPECYEARKEEENQRKLERLGAPGEALRIAELKIDQYHHLGILGVPAGCSDTCEHYRMALDRQNDLVPVCVNPSCHDKLTAEDRKSAKARRRAELKSKHEQATEVLAEAETDQIEDLAVIAFFQATRSASEKALRDAIARLGYDLDAALLKDYFQIRTHKVFNELHSKLTTPQLLRLAAEMAIAEEVRQASDGGPEWETHKLDWILGIKPNVTIAVCERCGKEYDGSRPSYEWNGKKLCSYDCQRAEQKEEEEREAKSESAGADDEADLREPEEASNSEEHRIALMTCTGTQSAATVASALSREKAGANRPVVVNALQNKLAQLGVKTEAAETFDRASVSNPIDPEAALTIARANQGRLVGQFCSNPDCNNRREVTDGDVLCLNKVGTPCPFTSAAGETLLSETLSASEWIIRRDEARSAGLAYKPLKIVSIDKRGVNVLGHDPISFATVNNRYRRATQAEINDHDGTEVAS